ncbi:MAG TPA: hypothetical protein VGY31_03150 [Terriglobia bacterium]|nr:hypothetical protein [Terriglobia bacterium]
MKWSIRLQSKAGSSPLNETIAKWREEANNYNPIQGKEYDWVWEYAQLRYRSAAETLRYVEEKSMSALKFASAVGTTAWVVFAFLEAKSTKFSAPNKVIVALAIVCLIASAILAALGFKPAQHLYLIDEQAALESVDQNVDKQRAIGKFILGLTRTTECEHITITMKGQKLVIAMYLLVASVILFILALSLALFL